MGGINSTLISNVVHCEADSKSSGIELPPVPNVSAPPSTDLPSLVQQVEEIEQQRKALPNPGMYEHALNEVKRVLTPDVFDGCRFEVHKPLGQRFAVSHTLWLGTQLIPGGLYQYGANVVLGSPQDPETILISRISPDGRLDARWHQKFSESASMRVQSQLASEEGQSQAMVDLDYRGSDFTGNFKVSNGPLFGLSYFQSVTPNLALGGEGYYHDQHKKSITSYSAKYSSDYWNGNATYGSMGTLQLHYLRKLSDRVKLASEFVYNAATGDSTAMAGAEFTLHRSRFVTNIDHTGKISSSLEAKLSPTITFLLSGEAQHSKDEFKFGYGVQIGQ